MGHCPYAIELDDRALGIASRGVVLACEPSVAERDGAALRFGTAAWSAARARPTAISSRHLGATLRAQGRSGPHAQLSARELADRIGRFPPPAGERIWMAAPASATADGLGDLLDAWAAVSSEPEACLAKPEPTSSSAVRDRGLAPVPVIDGVVDAAVVSVSALGQPVNAVVVEVGLHHLAATAIDARDGQARRRGSIFSARAGLLELYEAWLAMIGATAVKRTRFDPLHDGRTEQALFDLLPSLAAQAARDGHVRARLAGQRGQIDVELTRDQFSRAGEAFHRDLARAVHELRPAGAPVAIVMPASIAGLPGIAERLEQFVGCELVCLPAGFAAAATSLLELPERSADEPVRLLRRIPVQPARAPAGTSERRMLGSTRCSGAPPSHVLFEGRAFSLGSLPLVVGRTSEARAITLPEGLAGVSRRHCTFMPDSGSHVLLDHSGFGTFVNGERVAERARVYAGDRVRVGDPGIELALIAVGDAPPDG